jgi:predicted exporter
MTQYKKTQLASLLWLVVVMLLVVAAFLKKPVIDTSMMSLLPASQQQPLVHEASLQMGKQFSQRLLIIVSGADKTKVRATVREAATQLEKLQLVASVLWQVHPKDIQASTETLKPYRYVLLTDAMQNELKAGRTAYARDQALAQIINPVSMGKADLMADPFYLLPQWQLSQTPKFNVAIEDGLLRVNDESKVSYLVLLTFNQDAFQRKTQHAVLSKLQQLQAQFQSDGVTLTPSGLLIHADAGAKQAEREMSTIGLGSLIGILIIILLVFGSARHVVIIFVPVLIGCLVATASVFLLFERVHIVTFSFGAGLIGVSIDYALHYMCERHFRGDVIKHLLPSLFLGLCTSVVAYFAQAITPFPGLRQMALFSVFGLLGAWLTVVLWMPVMTRNAKLQPIKCIPHIKLLLQKMPSVDTHRWITPTLLLLAFFSILMINSGRAVDDLRLLQTSPASLIEQDAKVQTQLKLNSISQFLLIPCPALQQCLQQEEALKPHLQKLMSQGVLTNFDLLSDQLPSLQQQQNNVNLVKTLYTQELSNLFKTIHIPEKSLEQAKKNFDLDSQHRLTLDELPPTPFFQSLKAKVITTSGAGMATVVGLNTNTSDQLKQQLSILSKDFPQFVLVDQVDTISGLMKSYRHQVMVWVGLAYVLILVFCLARYKQRAIRVITPPLLASLMTAAILMHTVSGINLFHMLALILVLGIGMDMGIFLTETHQAEQTWLAVTLSIVTSLLAFGLLFLSQTPVLSHFGITVLLGLSFVWVLSVLLRPINIR